MRRAARQAPPRVRKETFGDGDSGQLLLMTSAGDFVRLSDDPRHMPIEFWEVHAPTCVHLGEHTLSLSRSHPEWHGVRDGDNDCAKPPGVNQAIAAARHLMKKTKRSTQGNDEPCPPTREGIAVARCTAARLMRKMGLFNHRRLLESIGNSPPAEAEERYYAQFEEQPWRLNF
jgi:hypothetical protein